MNAYQIAEYGVGLVGAVMLLAWFGIMALALVNNDLELTVVLMLVTLLVGRVAADEVFGI